MKVTNHHGLPRAFETAVHNDKYSKGESDYTASQLSSTPPRIEVLEKKHWHELEIDVKSRLWSMYGTGLHSILELGARPEIDIVEKRFFSKFPVDGREFIVSGQIDLFEQDTATLMDWKVSKWYPFSSTPQLKETASGQKPEWIAQLNINLELMRRNGLEASSLKIVGILRDWDQKCLDPSDRRFYKKYYPPKEVMVVDIPMWEREKTVAFIEERIRAFENAKHTLPECTKDETWTGRRCKVCSVSKFCDQYQRIQKTGLINKVEDVG